MSVLNEMREIRQKFIVADRRKAMEALTYKLHYKIAPRVTHGDAFTIFSCGHAVSEFCKEEGLDRRAVDWLFNAMREERLLQSSDVPVTLTPLGVEQFCCG